MQRKKLVLVEPKSRGHHVFSLFRLPRLGLPILGTLAARKGYDVRIYIEEATPAPFSQILEADLLCLSTITPTAPAAYSLADRARAAGVPVVIGGPHVTFLPDEALRHADWVVRGEGERSFPRLLDVIFEGRDPSAVPGLSWMDGGQAIHNPEDSRPTCMETDIPIPDFSLLAGKKGNRFPRGIIPTQTSRGCPHHCRFCSVTPMFGRQMRHLPMEQVAEELEARRGCGDQVFFYDDNFCAPAGRCKRLLDHLLTKDVFLPNPLAQCSVKAARDPELLALMQRAGFHTVFIGFESINPETLALYRKRQEVDDIRNAISRFHDHGIRVHGMFVTGSDADGVDTIRATARFAIQQKIDSVQFLVLTPLPGTPLIEELDREERLLTSDWSLYDTHHAVFQPARMTPYQLMTETFEAMAKVYSPRRILSLLARGKFQASAISLYARGQVQRWKRENKALLAAVRKGGADALRDPVLTGS